MFESAPDIASVVVTDLGLAAGLLALMAVLDPARAPDRALFGSSAALVMLTYAAWRWDDTMPPAEWSFESIWAHLFFALEFVAMMFSILSIIILFRHTDRSGQADRAEQRLAATNDWPAVDIFICTYNEPLDVLEKSITAAVAIDYPCATVWVLDDTGRSSLRSYCAEHGVRYVARSDNAGAKAGNLNHALAHTRAQTNAPIVLVLDADFVARPSILRRTVGLLAADGVALVQTPQFYYNPDPIQHNLAIAQSWIDDQRFFFDVFQPAKDAWGCAFCVGTSFVARRDRLEEVGGFPEQAISEDINLTYRLLARGYASIWLNERLSIGLSAEGLPEYITQRSRWCLGTIQVALLPDGPFRARGLSFTHRWHFAHGILNWLSKPFLVAMLVAPGIYWFGGVPAFHADYAAYMRYGVPALLSLWAYNFWISRGRTLPFFTELTEVIASFAVCATLAGALVAPFGKPFKVTDKGGDRSQPKVRWKSATAFGAIAAISGAGIVWSLFSPNAPSELPDRDLFNLLWTGVAMVIAFGAFLVCFERGRREHSVVIDEPSILEAPTGSSRCTLHRLSLSSAVLRGVDPRVRAGRGDDVRISIPDIGPVAGRITGGEWDTVSLELAIDGAERRRLLLHLFSGEFDDIARRATARGALGGLLQRAFQPDKADETAIDTT